MFNENKVADYFISYLPFFFFLFSFFLLYLVFPHPSSPGRCYIFAICDLKSLSDVLTLFNLIAILINIVTIHVPPIPIINPNTPPPNPTIPPVIIIITSGIIGDRYLSIDINLNGYNILSFIVHVQLFNILSALKG